MQLNWEKFQAAYASSTPELKLLIDGDKIPLCANSLIGKYNLTIPKSELIVCAVNKILNLETDDILIEYISQYTNDKNLATTILNELSVCSVGAEVKVASINKITEAPITPVEVPKLRTLASDGAKVGYASEDEPIHTSSQDSVLGR